MIMDIGLIQVDQLLRAIYIQLIEDAPKMNILVKGSRSMQNG